MQPSAHLPRGEPPTFAPSGEARAERPRRRPSTAWVVLTSVLLAASFSAHDGGAHRSFFVPKLLLTYAAALAALGILLSRRELRWPAPRASAWGGAGLVGLALLALRAPAPEQAWVELSVLACGLVVCFAVAQLSEDERRPLLWSVVATAALQLGLALVQVAGPRAWLPAALQPRAERAAFGSVGNPEFLATLLGVGAVLGLALAESGRSSWRRARATGIVAALLAGLVATRNKGGLALVGAWLLWLGLARWPRARRWAMAGALPIAVALTALVAPDSVKGRALLWLASCQAIAEHPWLGVGGGQLQNAYLPAVQALFARHAGLAASLGSYTAQVDDAHDLPLHAWASFGLVGLALAAALLWSSARVASRAGVRGWALAWLASKSVYTVVLGSLSGALLWAIALGLGPWRWQATPMTARRRWLLAAGAAVVLAPSAYGVRLALADRAYRRGVVADAKGDAAAALAAFDEAASWQPSFAEAHLGKAFVRFRKGERDEMQRELEAALRVGRTMDVVKISAHMRFYSHLYAQARPLYEFLHEVFPEHLTSMAKLSLIRLEAGDVDGARAMARELLATRPRHGNRSDAENREIARRILEEP